jgi:hypothetical protein
MSNLEKALQQACSVKADITPNQDVLSIFAPRSGQPSPPAHLGTEHRVSAGVSRVPVKALTLTPARWSSRARHMKATNASRFKAQRPAILDEVTRTGDRVATSKRGRVVGTRKTPFVASVGR